MLGEPRLALLIVRHGPFQTAPEGGGVVGLVQVNELMDDHVLGDVAGQQDGLPVEVDPVALAAGAPAVA